MITSNLYPSQTHNEISAAMFRRRVSGLKKAFDAKEYKKYQKEFGIRFDESVLKRMIEVGNSLPRAQNPNAYAMDATLQPTVTTGTISTPIQFLQEWLPGFTHVITQARKIDVLVGMIIAAAWEDEEVVQSVLELTGLAVPYGDYTNIPLASWNPNYERFSIVRFENGMQVLNLDQLRAARMNIDSAAAMRDAVALSLEIIRNTIGFFGYDNGNNRTFGFLNAEGSPPYVPVANGASGFPQWSTKTVLEIEADIKSWLVGIRISSGDNIDPESAPITLALATDTYDYITNSTNFNLSVRDWLNKNYPNVRVISIPQFSNANGGANVAYLFADEVNDTSTDDRRVYAQVVPTKFMVEGVQQEIKGYKEGYTNATAGVFLKRPFAVFAATNM